MSDFEYDVNTAEETTLPTEEMAETPVTEETDAPALAEESVEAAVPSEEKTWLHTMYELMGNIAVALLLVTVLLGFCFRQVVVDGDSMNDTLANKDRLLLQTVFYTPEREDIVVIYQEEEPEKPLIKRVIAVGGDAVKMNPATNEVYLKKAGENDWELLSEPYVNYPMGWGIAWDDDGEIVVPAGEVFVLGDHRNNSRDSRTIGCVKEENVVGGVLFRLFPFGGLK